MNKPITLFSPSTIEQILSDGGKPNWPPAIAESLSNQLAEQLITLQDSAAQSQVTVLSQEEGPYIVHCVIALRDRPFIVNTILEQTRRAGAEVHKLLYPIVQTPSGPISITYLKVVTAPPDLIEKLKLALTSLVCVVDDHLKMVALGESFVAGARSVPTPYHELLDLLFQGNAILLGAQRTNALGNQESFGLLRCPRSGALFTTDLAALPERTQLARASLESPVHRLIRPLYLTLDQGSEKFSLIFLLTSHGRALPSSEVPLLRERIAEVMRIRKAQSGTFLYKSLLNALNNIPKEELFCLENLELLNPALQAVLDVQSHRSTRVEVIASDSLRGALVMVFMPRERFNPSLRQKLQRKSEELMGAQTNSSEYLLDASDKTIARFYFSLPCSLPNSAKAREELLHSTARTLHQASTTWAEQLEVIIREKAGDQAELLQTIALKLFAENYQSNETPESGYFDLYNLSSATPGMFVAIETLPDSASSQRFVVCLYSVGSEVPLSKAMPVLDNAGLEVLFERSYTLHFPQGTACSLHRFYAQGRGPSFCFTPQTLRSLGESFSEILRGKAANDPLNQLLLTGLLSPRELTLFRAYASHLAQINKFATRHAIYTTLASYPAITLNLWRAFEIKFSPLSTKPLAEREQEAQRLLREARLTLHKVRDLAQDRIVRGLCELIECTVRTNFYQGKEAIAIKVASQQASFIPQPKPLFEIYVYSPIVEGIHLRSSRVSRGGIRWSDRKDDFRAEIIGLMKTQRVKNVVIVPSGAKGGFIVKSGEDSRAGVLHAYREYIRALLTVTDNRIAEKIITPAEIVAYDGEDPYLVVAADKGTATFSDTANEVAVKEFNFWLGDAFASGGSLGYDHKKCAITARGAWESVKRHFNELGLDYKKSAIRVVGIGDMSGDVFGNGLLYSDNLQLVAAFDHRHIFIDPTPDPQKSFGERQRLFALKGSSWESYDSKLLSPGGKVHSRHEKEISLTPEARTALGISNDLPATMSGEEIITHILKAPVELLWNGGIGTYVKAAQESHADVNDSSNDGVRVNGRELRAKVVAEGGNLGFTQRGRVEYALRGGRINTDAIDNSAGVDLSDHEVNLKIFFAQHPEISFEDRNEILKEMTDEVCSLVLKHNRAHALTLSIGVERSNKNVEYLKMLIRDLEKSGYLQRNLDALPSDEELEDRGSRGSGLTRPEFAAILAPVKMWIKDLITNSSIVEQKIFSPQLLAYFPSTMQTRFTQELFAHPLANHIVATELTNTLVDWVGVSFVSRVATGRALDHNTVIASSLAADLILDLASVREEIASLDNVEANAIFLKVHHDLRRSLRATATWLLSVHGRTIDIAALVEQYRPLFKQIVQNKEALHSFGTDMDLVAREKTLLDLGLSQSTARTYAVAPLIIPTFEMLRVSIERKCKPETAALAYENLVEALDVEEFILLAERSGTASRWEQELMVRSYDQIRSALHEIAIAIPESQGKNGGMIRDFLGKRIDLPPILETLREAKKDAKRAAAIAVIAERLTTLARVCSAPHK